MLCELSSQLQVLTLRHLEGVAEGCSVDCARKYRMVAGVYDLAVTRGDVAAARTACAGAR
ncbi:hypothetical protein [Prescottella subtropica]|uniref:hypothetical protein n=1 Tax=Prescottella subtropica TaxID=2545757 RepID=UPI0010F4861F|nr:hypothetical protein [Prescottella subtropica]